MGALAFNWDIVWNTLAVAVWLAQARWVYIDAERKYGRGRFWGLTALFLPLAGLLSYLLYERSSLVEIDMFDAEVALEVADTIQVRRSPGNRPIKRQAITWRRPGSNGQSPRDKREAKELRQKAKDAEKDNPLLAKELREKADMLDPPPPPKKPWRRRWREYWAIQRDRLGAAWRRRKARREYLRRPKKLRRHEEFAKKLEQTAYVDPTMEGLIFEGQYEVARERAIINLQIAEETGDSRKLVTYRRYLDQIDKITNLYFPHEDGLSEGVEKYHIGEDE